MKINRTWDTSKVVSYCIKFDRYTRGTNTEYTQMLDYVNNHRNPLDIDLLLVASNIVNHSNMDSYGQTHEENVQAVLFDLLNDCVTYDAEIEDSETDLLKFF